MILYSVGDIVKITHNKYYNKELSNHVCFVEQVLGNSLDRFIKYSLYALEKPIKPKLSCDTPYWYVGDILQSCLEPYSVKCECCNDLINNMPIEAIEEYPHFIYPTDKDKILLRMKKQENLK